MCLKLTKITTVNIKYDYSLFGNTFQEKNYYIETCQLICKALLLLYLFPLYKGVYKFIALVENQCKSSLTKVKDYKYSDWFCLLTYKQTEFYKHKLSKYLPTKS